jgi:hypothetical protein
MPSGETIPAWYVTFHLEAENPYMTGTMGFRLPVCGAPLFARESTDGPQDKDSDHIVFELMHLFYNQINEAVKDLGDPGVVADVSRY